MRKGLFFSIYFVLSNTHQSEKQSGGQVRKYLSGLGFLKEHFMAPHVTSENVDQVMAPLYHKLVEEESMLPPEQRRILPPQSWVCVVLCV